MTKISYIKFLNSQLYIINYHHTNSLSIHTQTHTHTQEERMHEVLMIFFTPNKSLITTEKG